MYSTKIADTGTVSGEFITAADHNLEFHCKIVTDDETWYFLYD
jgi:hypothetical protein